MATRKARTTTKGMRPTTVAVRRATARPNGNGAPVYLVVWWHCQRPYYSLFGSYVDARWTAETRNGIVVELVGRDLVVKWIADYWRRDENGNPLPAELQSLQMAV